MNEELKRLIDEIHKLNTYFDGKIANLEKAQKQLGELLDIPTEDRPHFNALSNDISAAKGRYGDALAARKEARLAAQRPGFAGNYSYGGRKSDSTRAIERWFRLKGDTSALTPDELSYISFNHMDMNRYAPEQKVLVSAAADLGGFYAGTDLSEKFVQKLFLVSPLRSLADTQPIGGEKLLLPSEGSTDTNIFWSDEQSGFQASTDPNLGMIEIYARELNGYLKLSKQNLEDSVFDIEAFILKRLTRQFAQKEGVAFLTGDGINRPEGILTNAAQAGTGINVLTSSTAATIKPADLINLMHQVKSGYRPTGSWLMSNNTIGVCRLFIDSQNRPLWTMFGDAFVETLFGRPIVEMPDMKNPATGTTTYTSGDMPVIFGDINQGYQIADRVGLTFQTLKELFAIQNQVAYLTRMRVGGKTILPEAIAVLKVA